MKTRNFGILPVLVVFCILFATASPVLAQEPPPPLTGEKPGGSRGPYREQAKAAHGAARQEISALTAQGPARGEGETTGPQVDAQAEASASAVVDGFGYTRKAVPLAWQDISATGAALDLSSAEVTSVALPFSFPFYENQYDTIKVARYGYLSFSQHPEINFQSPMLRPNEPNNLIAPYWTPILLAGGGVYYEAGGTAPDRFIIFEWDNVSDEWTGGDNRFNFQVVLYENGDIRFQYEQMLYTWGWNFATAGLEDDTGSVGHISLPYKTRQKSNRAVAFTRPQAGVSLKLFPSTYGAFAAIGGAAHHRLRVENTSLSGEDVYDIRISSVWPALALAVDGVTPLVDTDGDRRIDTGPVPAGAAVEVIIQVTTPATAKVGNNRVTSVTFTSSARTTRKKTAQLTTTIPAAFTQVYAQETLGDPVDVLGANFSPAGGMQSFPVALQSGGYNPAVTRMASGHGLYAWSTYTCPDFQCERVFYTILDAQGAPVLAATALADPPPGTWDFVVSAAGAPDGSVGLVFLREIYQNPGYLYNLYFVLLGSDGSVLSGPVNVTNNASAYNNSVFPPIGEIYFDPTIVATQDSHFILSWQREAYDAASQNVSDLYLAEYGPAGDLIRAPFPITQDVGGGMGYYGASLSLLTGNRLLVAYNGWKTRGRSWMEYAYYTVFDSAGALVRKETGLALGAVDSYGMDSVQLGNGQILLAWGVFKNGKEILNYAVLRDGTYARVKGPAGLSAKPALTGSWYASVTATADGQGVITWADDFQSFGRHLYYARFGRNGVLLNKPVIFLTAPETTYLYLNANGFGNTVYSP